jgi:hypothetical protein
MLAARLRFSFLAVTCALSLSMLGCGASQQSSKGDDTVVLYDKEKLVCKREHSTGSNIPVTRCYRRNEVNQRRDANQGQVEALRLQSRIEDGDRNVPYTP